MDIKKIDNKVQDILISYPENLSYNVIFVKNKKAVSEEFKRIYNINKKYRGFYSRRENTIFISKRNKTDRVIAHEICHVILCREYPGMPGRTQEWICQGIETFF